jgi:hypothetical protein
MIRGALSKVMWVGRATVFVVGLAVILAMVMGLASAAFSATGGNFILGQSNSTDQPTTLVGQIVDTTKSALVLKNPNGGSALQLQVNSGKAPMKVNSTAGKATNLNADKLDGQDSTAIGRELWAVMASDGSVVRSNGVIVASSKRNATGNYLVTFDRDVSNCSYVASPDDFFRAIALPNNGGPNAVSVLTYGFTGETPVSLTPSDVPFHLIVAC